jgi:hypothetical protein
VPVHCGVWGGGGEKVCGNLYFSSALVGTVGVHGIRCDRVFLVLDVGLDVAGWVSTLIVRSQHRLPKGGASYSFGTSASGIHASKCVLPSPWRC